MNLYDIPVKRKLLIVISLLVFLALFLASTAFFIDDWMTFKPAKARDFVAISRILGFNSAAAISFDDRKSAEEILQTLSVKPRVIAAAIYEKNDTLFASYRREKDAALPDRPGAEGYYFKFGKLEVASPILLNDQRIGTIYLQVDLKEMEKRLRRNALAALIILFITFGLTFAASAGFQKVITAPLLALSNVAKTVSTKKDYSVRASKYGRDEIGDLTDTFNEMLAEIQIQNLLLKKAHEERFRNFAESASEAIISADETGKIVYCNQGGEHMFGYSSGETNDRMLASLLPGFSLGDGAVGKTTDREGRRKNGEAFPLEVSVSSWREDETVFFTAIVRDISNRKKAEEELKRRSAQIEAANKELEAFSYSVSHDLRAPLRHIDGFVEILMKNSATQLDEKGMRHLTIVSDSVKQMGCLIDDLLSFSRMNRVEMKKSLFEAAPLVQEVIENLKQDSAGKKAEWKTADFPKVQGDRALLRQVFVNLLSNALKYSRNHPAPRIEVACSEKPEEIVFSVKDNGVGFDMQYYEKLFGVFQRLHRAEDFEGTGIGLANVQRIIQRHGGKVWAEGIVDGGATFYFSLPHAK